MWLKSKLDDGMVFRSVQGAMRDWLSCIGNTESIGVENSHVSVCALDFMNMDENFELGVFPDAAIHVKYFRTRVQYIFTHNSQ